MILSGAAKNIFTRQNVWVSTTSKLIPRYQFGVSHCEICSVASKDPQLSRNCQDFYSSKPEGVHACPFGITVETRHFEIDSNEKIALHLQIRFEADKLKHRLSELPRKQKKMASAVLERTPSMDFETLPDNSLTLFESILQSLLLSRVASAIQAVSHEILTPVHGLVSDVEVLKKYVVGPEATEVFERLNDNLDAIAGHAKRIGMLLTPEHWFNPNRYRDVTVHVQLKNIARRLGSIAGNKEVTINIGYNSHKLRVPAIPDLLELVLASLLENAIKYAFSK